MKRNALSLLFVPLLLLASEAGAGVDTDYLYKEFSYPGDDVTSTFVSDLNNRGEISGIYYHGANPSWGISDYLYDGEETFSRIDLSIAGSYSVNLQPHEYFSGVQAINDKKELIGHVNRVDGGDYYSFFYNGDSYKKIVLPDTDQSFVSDLNNSGQVIGNYISKGQFEQSLFPYYKGFVYDLKTDTYGSVQFPGADYTYVTAGNDNGQFVGFYGNYGGGDRKGFLYDGNAFISLDGPVDSMHSEIYITDINNLGQIIGSWTSFAKTFQFMYIDGEYKFIDLPWETQAEAINDFGQIAGTRWNTGENFASVGFLLEYGSIDSITASLDELDKKYYPPYEYEQPPVGHEVPEPAVLQMAGLGLASIYAMARRKSGARREP